MALTLQLSEEAEAWLQAQAKSAGKDVVEFASTLLEQAARQAQRRGQYEVSPQEQERLQKVFDELLARAEALEPDPNRPRLRGQEVEIEAIIVEKFRKQGFRL